MLKAGVQSYLKEIGDGGCLALCLIKIAERVTGKDFDPVRTIGTALEEGWMERDMYVSDPAAFMRLMCGGRWTYAHSAEPSIDNEKSEFTVERWERKTPSGCWNHFRLPDWDSLEDSQTVKYGKIQSYRLVKRIG